MELLSALLEITNNLLVTINLKKKLVEIKHKMWGHCSNWFIIREQLYICLIASNNSLDWNKLHIAMTTQPEKERIDNTDSAEFKESHLEKEKFERLVQR